MYKDIIKRIKKLVGKSLSVSEIRSLGLIEEYFASSGEEVSEVEIDVICNLYKKSRNSIDWDKVARSKNQLHPWFIEDHFEFLRPFGIVRFQKFTDELIRKYLGKYDLDELFQYQVVSESTIEYIIRQVSSCLINWNLIFKTQQVSLDFIEKYSGSFTSKGYDCWSDILRSQKSIDENYLIEFIDRNPGKIKNSHWQAICQGHKLSSKFIERYHDIINWNYIVKFQKHIKIKLEEIE